VSGSLKFGAYRQLRKKQEARGVVMIRNNPFPEPQGFATEDILWAVGVWSVILSLLPVVVFYVLRVN
jgi:hypothetical protein